jgi:pantoate--beta-alanine ligase
VKAYTSRKPPTVVAIGELYPAGFATWVEPELTGLEGEARPGHFRGVATVCLKLFNIVRPERAYFGQKDAQQAAVLRRLVRDLNVPVEIRVLPTVRDDDGLALSSRNARLSATERASAAAIPRALRAAVAASRERRDPIAAARAELHALAIEYVDIAHWGGEPTLVLAVRAGATRLIDNVPLEHPERAGLGSDLYF